MLLDARSLASGDELSCDVCIVGAGAAGIALATELARLPLDVCLLEAGGESEDPAMQDLYRGENVGRFAGELDQSRLRYFGGTTNVWGGTCRPLDAIDFEQRPWVPHSGWPFPKAELDPWYARAAELCELAVPDFETESWEAIVGSPRLPLRPEVLATRMFLFSPPTRFGQRYRSEIERARNLRALLHANVLEVETDATGGVATGVRVATIQGGAFRVTARSVVLAAGGIENVRLLLLSRRARSCGLGNEHDLVGRFFMEHPHFSPGQLHLAEPPPPLDLYREGEMGERRATALIALAPEVMERDRLLNVSVAIHTMAFEPRFSPGVEALQNLWWDVRRGDAPSKPFKNLAALLRDVGGVARYGLRRLRRAPEPDRVFAARVLLRNEQAPNPDSRVTLSDERDALGQPRVRLDWKLDELDVHSVRRSSAILAHEFQAAGVGRLRWTLPQRPEDWWLGTGSHHIGTTRMHADPRRGVVDANGRVHGVAGLYLAGSSVFPTSGYANPTFTIVALALRLAGHLREALS